MWQAFLRVRCGLYPEYPTRPACCYARRRVVTPVRDGEGITDRKDPIMVMKNFNAGKSRVHGAPTERIGVGGTDLGFLFEGGKQFPHEGRSSMWVGGIFGDTFADFPGSGNWRSPVMMRSGSGTIAPS